MRSDVQSSESRRATWMHPNTERTYPIEFVPTLPNLLHRAVERFGDSDAVVTLDERVTFAELERRSGVLAKRLVATGVGKGSRVGILFPQGSAWIEAFLAVTRVGAVAMAFSTFATATELRKSLRFGDVQMLLAPPTLFGREMTEILEEISPGSSSGCSGEVLNLVDLPFLRSIVIYGGHVDHGLATIDDALLKAIESEVVPADWMVCVYTSGTTNDPKAVIHTHGAQIRHSESVGTSFGAEGAVFAAMPFFWIGGLTVLLLPALHRGVTLLCQERFDSSTALDLIERERPTQVSAWPSTLQRLTNDPSYAFRDLEGVGTLRPVGAPPVDPEATHGIFGMTEASGPYSIAPASEWGRELPPHLRGSQGRLAPYVEHRIADFTTNETLPYATEGEICIRGYNVMVGMYKREREDVFDAEGWYHTADRGLIREDCLFFIGRNSDMIKTAGSNVSPAEVVTALQSCEGIEEAHVVGLPDTVRGEIVVAGVVTKKGVSIDIDAIRKQLRTVLSAYKVPQEIVVLRSNEVARVVSDKPDRRRIMATIAEKLGRPVPPSN
jgi:acyl-CoA synthetase (AMP-forming)/AMP-acid ligase II